MPINCTVPGVRRRAIDTRAFFVSIVTRHVQPGLVKNGATALTLVEELGCKSAEEVHEKLQRHYQEMKILMGKLGVAINQGTDEEVMEHGEKMSQMLNGIPEYVRAAW